MSQSYAVQAAQTPAVTISTSAALHADAPDFDRHTEDYLDWMENHRDSGAPSRRRVNPFAAAAGLAFAITVVAVVVRFAGF